MRSEAVSRKQRDEAVSATARDDARAEKERAASAPYRDMSVAIEPAAARADREALARFGSGILERAFADRNGLMPLIMHTMERGLASDRRGRGEFDELFDAVMRRHPSASRELLARLVRAYRRLPAEVTTRCAPAEASQLDVSRPLDSGRARDLIAASRMASDHFGTPREALRPVSPSTYGRLYAELQRRRSIRTTRSLELDDLHLVRRARDGSLAVLKPGAWRDVGRATGLAERPEIVEFDSAILNGSFEVGRYRDPADLFFVPHIKSIEAPPYTAGQTLLIHGLAFNVEKSRDEIVILMPFENGTYGELVSLAPDAASPDGKTLQVTLPVDLKPAAYGLRIRNLDLPDGNESNQVALTIGLPVPPPPFVDTELNDGVFAQFPGRNLFLSGDHLKEHDGFAALRLEPLDHQESEPRYIVPLFSSFTNSSVVFPLPYDIAAGKYRAQFIKSWDPENAAEEATSNAFFVNVTPYHFRGALTSVGWSVFGIGGYGDTALFTTADHQGIPGLLVPGGGEYSTPLSWCQWNVFGVFTAIADRAGFVATTKTHALSPNAAPTALGEEGRVMIADDFGNPIEVSHTLAIDARFFAFDPNSSIAIVKDVKQAIDVASTIGAAIATAVGYPAVAVAIKVAGGIADQVVGLLIFDEVIPSTTTLVFDESAAIDFRALHHDEAGKSMSVPLSAEITSFESGLPWRLKTSFRLDRVES